ncbi:hypothetical protein QOZ80_9BG0717200 [Eleusine coracana subsp. coracana]|nr:hypothetical protein QOZ80_9BG0717200 [Eleusine coracana subsp. coracana]
MAANCKFSDLPDDLLRRVLLYLPAKEGASTAVLSQRWRSLWRTSGTVNLNASSCDDDDSKRKAFFRGAMAALSSGRVTRLSFHMEAETLYGISSFVSYEQGRRNLIHDVIANNIPATTRHVQQLRIAGVARNLAYCKTGGYYSLSFNALLLPCEALRVLHIVNAKFDRRENKLLGATTTISFPRLNTLQLHGCHVTIQDVRDVIHGAPQLATVRLESIHIKSCDEDSSFSTNGCQIRGQEVTALVITDWTVYGYVRAEIVSIEFDMPKLRYFRFDGVLYDQLVSLKSCVPNVPRVDFHFKDTVCDADKAFLPSFWNLLGNLTSAKFLKLKVDRPLDHVAVVNVERLDELLDNKLLYNLERLEAEGCYEHANNAAGHAIGNLLHCCPMLRDLRLKINNETGHGYMSYDSARQLQFQDFDMSVKNFRRHRGTSGSNKVDKYDEVPHHIHGLSEQIFNCLQSHLTRLSLQLRNEEEGFFDVQLVKFFAENAMVLEQVHIDDGNRKMRDHLNDMFRRWALNSAERINVHKALQQGVEFMKKRAREVASTGDELLVAPRRRMT